MAKNRSKTEKPPAIDKLLKPAIGVVLAFIAYYFMKGINADVSSKFQFPISSLEIIYPKIKTLLTFLSDRIDS
jgi:hypothetical protein